MHRHRGRTRQADSITDLCVWGGEGGGKHVHLRVHGRGQVMHGRGRGREQAVHGKGQVIHDQA